MNNLAALNILNIGFIQIVLEYSSEELGDLTAAFAAFVRPAFLDALLFGGMMLGDTVESVFIRAWCIGVHSLKRRTRMKTGNNGLGIYINRVRT